MSDERIERWLKLRCPKKVLLEEMLSMAASLCRTPSDKAGAGYWSVEKLDVVECRAFAEHVAAGRISYVWEPGGPIYPVATDSLLDWWEKETGDEVASDGPPDELIGKLKPTAARLVSYLWDGNRRTLAQIRKAVWVGKKVSVKDESIVRELKRAHKELEGTRFAIRTDKGKWHLDR